LIFKKIKNNNKLVLNKLLIFWFLFLASKLVIKKYIALYKYKIILKIRYQYFYNFVRIYYLLSKIKFKIMISFKWILKIVIILIFKITLLK
jgi:hypothetical protein